MQHGRKTYIDIMKGIGIILVLFGHLHPNTEILIYIYSFHMPLFFFISGYLYNSDKYKNYIPLMKAKAKSLLFPYFVFAIISLALIKQDINSSINQLFVLDGNSVINNGALWFLICLFIVELMYFTILRISKDIKITTLILITICGFVGYFLSVNKLPIPFKIDSAFVAIIFFGIGNLIRGFKLSTKKSVNGILFVVTISLSFLLSNYVIAAVSDMNGMVYKNYILFILVALIGIISIYSISILIGNSKILEYLGRNSIVILAAHLVIFSYINRFCNIRGIPPEIYIYGNIPAIIYTAVTLIICVPIIYIINKYFPFILGKKNIKYRH